MTVVVAAVVAVAGKSFANGYFADCCSVYEIDSHYLDYAVELEVYSNLVEYLPNVVFAVDFLANLHAGRRKENQMKFNHFFAMNHESLKFSMRITYCLMNSVGPNIVN